MKIGDKVKLIDSDTIFTVNVAADGYFLLEYTNKQGQTKIANWFHGTEVKYV